uniref:PHD-type domain-containing protein n=1 Tax=Oryza brachyantha TaxID=4533 RepID=J3L6H4_ORYBR
MYQQLVVFDSQRLYKDASVEAEAMYDCTRALIELSKSTPGRFCKVCNEVEMPNKRFLICGHSLCPYKFYHIWCLKPKQIVSDEQLGNENWYCPSCLSRVCKLDRDDEHIILCDGCDEGYHLYCLTPPLTTVPEGQWHCSSCAVQGIEAKMRLYELKILRLHRKDATMFETCGFAEHEAANVLMLMKNSNTDVEMVVSPMS